MDTDLVQVVIIGVDGTPATRYNSHQTTRLVCQSRKRNPTPEMDKMPLIEFAVILVVIGWVARAIILHKPICPYNL